jgi:hypothetical protein
MIVYKLGGSVHRRRNSAGFTLFEGDCLMAQRIATGVERKLSRREWLERATAGLAGTAFLGVPRSAKAEDLGEYRETIQRGLEWVARNQSPQGHWEATGGNYPMAMTGLCGLALALEGSTLRDGKYADKLRKAVNWFVDRAQPNGLLAKPSNPMEAQRYIYGHGYGLLFLSQVYGEEEDLDRRKKLEQILVKGVEFACKAVTPSGGWGYLSSADGNGFDEGSTTVTQLQALRACRNAGIPVPKSIIDNAQKYLKECTGQDGGIFYRKGQGGPGSPALTAAGLAGGFSIGEYNSPEVKRWLEFCRKRIPLNTGNDRFGHDEYTHYYYAQALYTLGEDGYDRVFPNAPESERLTWKKYRAARFPAIAKSQKRDGSWDPAGSWGGHVGTVYCTAVNLTILQLDHGTLPFYQR